ncbi:MAG: tetratricopeptide repeat protein [Xanthobacteraceae bacterium]|jgi:tetratricopeptide (TPR) repeat protein
MFKMTFGVLAIGVAIYPMSESFAACMPGGPCISAGRPTNSPGPAPGPGAGPQSNQPSAEQNAYNLDLQGDEYYKQGKYDLAIRSYEQALQWTPNDATIKNNAKRARMNLIAVEAYNAYRANNFDLAARLYAQALQFAPDATASDALTRDIALAKAKATVPVEPPTVDAQGVWSGLPPEIEAQIAHTPVGANIHKAFVVINDKNNDPERWAEAHVWFGQALLIEPGNEGIQRLVELSEYMMHVKIIRYPSKAMDEAMKALGATHQ